MHTAPGDQLDKPLYSEKSRKVIHISKVLSVSESHGEVWGWP